MEKAVLKRAANACTSVVFPVHSLPVTTTLNNAGADVFGVDESVISKAGIVFTEGFSMIRVNLLLVSWRISN